MGRSPGLTNTPAINWLHHGYIISVQFIDIHISDQPETIPDWYTQVIALFEGDCKTEPWRVRRDMFPEKLFGKISDHESVLKVANTWTDDCFLSHGCEQYSGTEDPEWYPERLIDLADPTSPRLLQTRLERPQGRYATLSHCWGLDPFITLGTDNLESFCERIATKALAKAFAMQ